METKFYILLTIRTLGGPESFAQFFIGNNRSAAQAVFAGLKGTPDVKEENVLYMEFMETAHGLPVNLELIGCTLAELVENCKLITKEVFKIKNLEEL